MVRGARGAGVRVPGVRDARSGGGVKKPRKPKTETTLIRVTVEAQRAVKVEAAARGISMTVLASAKLLAPSSV